MSKEEKFKDTIRRIVDDDPRYAIDAYEFINQAVSYTANKLKRSRKARNPHISGQELLKGISEYAIEQFGPMASEVLKNWGLKDGSSIGNVVFNMVEQQLLYASKDESIEDFHGDFNTLFKASSNTSRKKSLKPPIIV